MFELRMTISSEVIVRVENKAEAVGVGSYFMDLLPISANMPLEQMFVNVFKC